MRCGELLVAVRLANASQLRMVVASFCGKCVNGLNLLLSGGKFVEFKGHSVLTHAHSTYVEILAITRHLKSTVALEDGSGSVTGSGAL